MCSTGGERAAAMYSLIGTARVNGLDRDAYLAYVLEHIADQPINRIDELLPSNVAPSLPSTAPIQPLRERRDSSSSTTCTNEKKTAPSRVHRVRREGSRASRVTPALRFDSARDQRPHLLPKILLAPAELVAHAEQLRPTSNLSLRYCRAFAASRLKRSPVRVSCFYCA